MLHKDLYPSNTLFLRIPRDRLTKLHVCLGFGCSFLSQVKFDSEFLIIAQQMV